MSKKSLSWKTLTTLLLLGCSFSSPAFAGLFDRVSDQDQTSFNVMVSNGDSGSITSFLSGKSAGEQAILLKGALRDGTVLRNLTDVENEFRATCQCTGPTCASEGDSTPDVFNKGRIETGITLQRAAEKICSNGNSDGCDIAKSLKDQNDKIVAARNESNKCIAKFIEEDKAQVAATDKVAQDADDFDRDQKKKLAQQNKAAEKRANSPEGLKASACAEQNEINSSDQTIAQEKSIENEAGVENPRARYLLVAGKQAHQDRLAALKKKYRDKTGTDLDLSSCPNKN